MAQPISIRDAFFDSLYDIAKADKNVIFVTADCGAPSLDKFREDLKEQYYTVGIAEQNMIAVAAGLALEGKIPYTYAIAPFASLRCYEQIKVNLSCMNLPVTVVGVGAGLAYDIMGPTHHATEDISIMRALPGLAIYNPSDSTMSAALAGITHRSPGPKYVRFDRGDLPSIYADKDMDFTSGLCHLKKGSDLCIIATGVMVHKALEVAEIMRSQSIDAGVVDLYRIKPVDEKALLGLMDEYANIVTLEEHFVIGGIGSLVSEFACDNGKAVKVKRLGLCNEYYFEYGGRERLHQLCNLDTKSIVDRITAWLPQKANEVAQKA